MSLDNLECAGYTMEPGRTPQSWVFRDVHGREVADFSEEELVALHYLSTAVLGPCEDMMCACYDYGDQKAMETVGVWNRLLGD